ncbi:MAG: response regulator [Bacteroidetes bacterium]|nr:response regulator [Bacteroidota bacterium]
MNSDQKSAFRKIDRKIYVVFFLVIVIASINALISTLTIKKSHHVTSDLVNNTNPSMEALTRFNLLVTTSKMLTTNWVYLPTNNADKDSLRNINSMVYVELHGRMNGLMGYWKDTTHIAKMNSIFNEYNELTTYQTQIMRLLSDFDDYQDPLKMFSAGEILEREVIPRSEKITEDLRIIMVKRSEMAAKQQDEMLYSFNSLMVMVLGFAILIILSILFLAYILMRSFIVPVLTVRGIIMRMGQGELPELKMKFPKNAVGEMMQALRFMVEGFRQTSTFAEEIGKSNFDHPYKPLSANDVQGHALLQMRNQLKAAYEVEARRTWLVEGLSELNEIMRANQEDFNVLLDRIIDKIVDRLEVQQAAIFLLHNDDLNDLHIQLGAYYALNNKILNSRRYELKEGLIGQAIASNKTIEMNEVSDPYFTIDTGMGESKSCSIIIIPLITSGKVVGAIEVASVKPFTSAKREMLEKMAEPIAASLFSLRANLITTQLLEESRKQADELVYQEQELRKINNELTKQSQLLRQSEEEMKSQQEELQQVNIELQDKAQLLQQQNVEIEDARVSLVFKAEQLEQSNKYKSAFLANMSHELRTPLNSILILAKLLADNKTKNLSDKQTEHATIIHKSGSDLLNLINEILDLSKIEAGKIEFENEVFDLKFVADDIRMLFKEYAADKKINFEINQPKSSVCVNTDKTRLEQVIKNLLSNAFKFTPEEGTVSFTIALAPPDAIFKEKSLLQSEGVVSLSVKDTGIGIPEDKQKQVFEAFQQADGSTSRKFGGTGLGLAISRELVNMMGGEITLESIEGAGSTFTIHLSLSSQSPGEEHTSSFVKTVQSSIPEVEKISISASDEDTAYDINEIRDDRNNIQEKDKVILIVEDDYVFARMLMNQCHRFNYKAVIALQGDQGLSYASKYKPYAIILDLRLPVIDGWTVLKRLKENVELKRIPVHIISSVDKSQLGLAMGATSYLHKPAGKQEMEELFRVIDPIHQEHKKLLVLGSENQEVNSIIQKLNQKNIEVKCAITLDECEELAKNDHFSGLILTTQQNNEDWLSNSTQFQQLKNIPALIFENNSEDFMLEIDNLISNDLIKTRESVLDAAGSFLNEVEKGNKFSKEVNTRMENMLTGKTVLIVDDDMRNIYSLTNILEQERIIVICAYDGIQAIDRLRENPQIDLVLMDIMMPNMNGYEATQKIRKNPEWEHLPVIAVTAKAMNGDREKSIEAGASDYLTKPINADQLISLMKVWMYK